MKMFFIQMGMISASEQFQSQLFLAVFIRHTLTFPSRPSLPSTTCTLPCPMLSSSSVRYSYSPVSNNGVDKNLHTTDIIALTSTYIPGTRDRESSVTVILRKNR